MMLFHLCNTHVCWYSALSAGRVAARLRVGRPVDVDVVENRVREHLIGGENHLERVRLCVEKHEQFVLDLYFCKFEYVKKISW